MTIQCPERLVTDNRPDEGDVVSDASIRFLTRKNDFAYRFSEGSRTRVRIFFSSVLRRQEEHGRKMGSHFVDLSL